MNTQPNLLPNPARTQAMPRAGTLPPTRPVCTRRLCLPQLVASVADRFPDAVAATAGDARMSYSELNGRAEQLAGHLQSLGVQPEVPVGLCVERSFDYVVAALAIWKAGGAYVPLDPAWPAEHREFILADAQAPVLITRSGMACKARYIVNLDHDAEAIARSSAPSNPGTTRDHLAYIIYTS
ncbi:MAG: AMP-binding protein, partial [Bryobacteraceae bacterium]